MLWFRGLRPIVSRSSFAKEATDIRSYIDQKFESYLLCELVHVYEITVFAQVNPPSNRVVGQTAAEDSAKQTAAGP